MPVHGGTVNLSVGAADVQVTQAAGSTAPADREGALLAGPLQVTWHPTASGVTVSTQCHFVTGVCSFSFRAVLPAGKRAVLSDGSGNLTLRGLTGPVSAGSGSGDVQANQLSGTVSFQSGSGNIIRQRHCPGRKVHRASRPRPCSGTSPFTVRTSLDVTVSNGSGNVVIIFAKVPDRVRVSDQSGNMSSCSHPVRRATRSTRAPSQATGP